MLSTGIRPSPATPVRASSLHSMITAASAVRSVAVVISMPSTSGNGCRYGGGTASITTRASLPSARKASAIATADPMASPSGRWCDEIRKRLPVRSALRSSAGGSAWLILRRIGWRVDERIELGMLLALGVQVLDDALDPV